MLVECRSSTASQAHAALSVSPVRGDECEAEGKKTELITRQNGGSHLLLMTEYPPTGDKEIPFVGNGHSALFQRNPLTARVNPWVSGEIMLPSWWRAEIYVAGYCH